LIRLVAVYPVAREMKRHGRTNPADQSVDGGFVSQIYGDSLAVDVELVDYAACCFRVPGSQYQVRTRLRQEPGNPAPDKTRCASNERPDALVGRQDARRRGYKPCHGPGGL